MPMLHVVHMLLLLLTLTLPIDQALTDLGDNDWRVRERAYFVLNARMNTNLYGRIHELRDKTTDLEVSVRLNQLIHAHQLKTNPYLFFRRLFP